MRVWLRNLREEKKLTMKQVAEAIEITEAYYCAIENGYRKKRMDAVLILRLASVFGVEAATILAYEADYMDGRQNVPVKKEGE